MGDVLAPSPVESDRMLAAAYGAAWWAGFTPRGIPIGEGWGASRGSGCAPIRAVCCLHGSRILGFAVRLFAGAREPRNPKPVRVASSHSLAPRCPRVRSGYSPVGGSFRVPLRASSAMGRPADARAPLRSGRARACPPRRAASAGREIGTRSATAAPCLRGGCPRGPHPGSPAMPSPGKPSTRRLPRMPCPPRSTRAR